jgi:hypothetical protein
MSKNQFWVLASLMFLILLFVACQPLTGNEPSSTPFVSSEPIANYSYAEFMRDPKCYSPCWVGIQVGLTTFDEAKNILTSRYGKKNISIINSNSISWKASSIDGLREGIVNLSDDIVSEIMLFPDQRVFFEVNDLLKIFSEPTWVQVFQDPNNSCHGISLLYSEIGVYVILDLEDGSKGVLPSQSIFLVRMLDSALTRNWNAYDSILIRWDGYKNYCQE